MLIGVGLPSPVTLLFNSPIRGLLPQMNRELININNDATQFEGHKACQGEYVKNIYTHKDSLYFPIGSTVAVPQKDGAPWIHGIIKETNNSDYSWRSYIVMVLKTAD